MKASLTALYLGEGEKSRNAAYKAPDLSNNNIVICKMIVGAAIGRPLQQYGIAEADEQNY
jgi:hypothetical protein